MRTEYLNLILEAHTVWLESGGSEGKKADLSGADLFGVDWGHRVAEEVR